MTSIGITELLQNLLKAFGETFLMCGASIALAVIVGVPLGLFIFITRKGLFWEFCSVPDPVKGLQEIRRVCKRDGNIILLEHVRSRNRIIGFLMNLMNPAVVRIIGANINRDTVNNLEKAGLTVHTEENLMMDIVKYLKCSK